MEKHERLHVAPGLKSSSGMKTARLLATLAAALGLAGCMDCSQAGCVAQLQVEVAMTPAEAPTVEVCRDGTCYGPTAVGAATETMAYTDDLYLQAYLSEEDGVATVHVSADEYDDRMSPDHPPADVPWIVRVRNGSQLLVEETFVPDYEVSYPNGEACGPTCYHASRSFGSP